MTKIKFDVLWFLVFLQALSTLSYAWDLFPTTHLFSLAHEDYTFVILVCSAFIRDSILELKGR